MFAGIVEQMCPVRQVEPASAGVRLAVELNDLLDSLALGASIAINGVCLTLTRSQQGVGWFDVVPETWRLTNLARLTPGSRVNVERSLRVGDRIDGHFVQGHVDGQARVERIDRTAGEWKSWFRPTSAAALEFIVPKGSITIDGVSLTVVDVRDGCFSVALIPTTLERTTLGSRTVGDSVNIETDILARLVIHQLKRMDGNADEAGITLSRLKADGFLHA